MVDAQIRAEHAVAIAVKVDGGCDVCVAHAFTALVVANPDVDWVGAAHRASLPNQTYDYVKMMAEIVERRDHTPEQHP